MSSFAEKGIHSKLPLLLILVVWKQIWREPSVDHTDEDNDDAATSG